MQRQTIILWLYDNKCGGMGSLYYLRRTIFLLSSEYPNIYICRYQQEYDCVSVYIKYIIYYNIYTE